MEKSNFTEISTMVDEKEVGKDHFEKKGVVSTRKKKILVVLGMGGHSSQMLRLVDSMENVVESIGPTSNLGNSIAYNYVVGHDDQTSRAKIKHLGEVFVMKNPRLMKDTGFFGLMKVVFKMVPATIDAFKILRKSKPDVIISSGPALTIPLFWLAKLIGVKTIFVESWVRVHNGSLTGKLVYAVSDLFFVQWESLKKKYRRAVFAGRLS